MSENRNRLRLDQILLEEGLVTEDQIFNALSHQRQQGGRIGMHLLLLGYIDEAGLVKALAHQSNCKGVVLTGLKIPHEVLKLVPAQVAISRKILPFDYNPEDNSLKVACETPHDHDLVQELLFVARGKKIKLHVAAELPLINAIANFYMGMEISPDRPFIELPPFDFETKRKRKKDDSAEDKAEQSTTKVALIVSDDAGIIDGLKTILEYDNYQVMVTDNLSDATKKVEAQNFDALFIKDSSSKSFRILKDRLRSISPSTEVMTFNSSADLVIPAASFDASNDLTLKNMEILSSLLESNVKQPAIFGESMGSLVEQLCNWLNFQSNDRLLITSAAYLSSLSRHYYGADQLPPDRKSTIAMTARLLKSMNFSPAVIKILESAYIEVTDEHATHPPLHIVGGNIITVADHYRTTVSDTTKLTLHKLELSRQEFQSRSENIFRDDVVKAFFDMLVEKTRNRLTKRCSSQVLLYADDHESIRELENYLQNDGFRTISECDSDGLAELYIRSLPGMMVLHCSGSKEKTLAFIDDLRWRGMDLPLIPTFVLTSGDLITDPEPLLRRGVNDVLPLSDRLNLLGQRLNDIRNRQTPENKHEAFGEVDEKAKEESATAFDA